MMNRLAAHPDGRLRKVIEAKSAELWFSLLLIGLRSHRRRVSKMNALLKTAPACAREVLVETMTEALETVNPGDAQGFLAHCGDKVEARPT
jgi:hypothetical protein